MTYISGEMRARHAFVDSAQSELAEILAQPELAERLGSEEHSMLLERNKQIFVPNMHRNKIRMPRKYIDTERIPLVPVFDNESFTFRKQVVAQTPNQRDFMQRWLQQIEIEPSQVERIARRIHEAHARAAHKAVYDTDETLGVTTNLGANAELTDPARRQQTRNYRFGSRPIVALTMDAESHVPTVLAHELTHATQAIAQPILAVSEIDLHILESELHAYRNSGILARFLLDEYLVDQELRWDLHTHAGVEQARAEHAYPGHPYVPNERMLSAIHKVEPFAWATLDFESPEQPSSDDLYLF